jgi:hypothetical protein
VRETEKSTSSTEGEPRDLCRILLWREDGSELLLRKTGAHSSLPTVEIPRWERPTENINAAVQNLYGISAHCLFPAKSPGPGSLLRDQRLLYQVMETDTDAVMEPEGMVWVPETLLSEHAFAYLHDAVVLASVGREIAAWRKGDAQNSLCRPGWLRDLVSWVEQKIAPLGLCLTGTLRQLNSGSTFALLRLETTGPAVWFKATGEPNQHERAVSVALADLFPQFVPRVIAVHPGWNGWLTLEAEGRLLEENGSHSAWQSACRALADVQIASVGRTMRLLESGCKDTRICCLQPHIGSFLEVMAGLMSRQTKIPPRPLDRNELSVLGDRIERVCREVDELAVPDTLGHLDVNPGNIVTSESGCVFLDWAEGSVGHPFVTLEYLRSHFRRAGNGSENGLFAPYIQSWERLVGPETVSKARRLAPLLAVYTLAVAGIAWRNAEEISNPGLEGYLRSLTRRMWAEAGLLNQKANGD